MSLQARVEALTQEVESIKRSLQQRSVWNVPTLRNQDSMVYRIQQTAHGFEIGNCVACVWDDVESEAVWELAWAFMRLERPTGVQNIDTHVIGAMGIVTKIVNDNICEITTSGPVTLIKVVDGEVLTVTEKFGDSYYLTEDRTQAGKLTAYRTTSGIHVARANPQRYGDVLALYSVSIFRDNNASFDIIDYEFDNVKVLVDDAGTITVGKASNNPETRNLRIALCSYDGDTKTVVVTRGKCWLSSNQTTFIKGGDDIVGTRWLSDTGTGTCLAPVGGVDPWDASPGYPKIAVGFWHADGGFDFAPTLKPEFGMMEGPAILGKYDDGFGDVAPIVAADYSVLICDSSSEVKFITAKNYQVLQKIGTSFSFRYDLQLGDPSLGNAPGSMRIYGLNWSTYFDVNPASGFLKLTIPSKLSSISLDSADFGVKTNINITFREMKMYNLAGTLVNVLVPCSQDNP